MPIQTMRRLGHHRLRALPLEEEAATSTSEHSRARDQEGVAVGAEERLVMDDPVDRFQCPLPQPRCLSPVKRGYAIYLLMREGARHADHALMELG